MARTSLRKSLLAVTIGAALTCGASGTALADGSTVEALESRVAELEALVQQLLHEKKAPAPTVDAAALEAKAESAAEAKVLAIMEKHHEEKAEAEKKHSYKFGGYIKTDVIYSDYDGGSRPAKDAGRDFYIPAAVPVGGMGESTYLDYHAKESRIFFRSDHVLDSGDKLRTYFEMDGMLSPGGDERISNSYNPRIRHAFIGYNNWTFGQTWMTFFNVGALPENLDFVGPAESTIFGRQAQIRYTNGPWMFALENPETTVTPFGGGGRIVTDDNGAPDVVLRYNHSGDFGSFTIATLIRQLNYEDQASEINDSTGAISFSLSGKHNIGDKDDFRWMFSTGAGMGRYIGLNTTNGAVLTATGELEAIDATGFFGSFRHFWSDKLRSNFTYGRLSVDNDTALTGMGATAEATSFHANLIYSPVPKLDLGVELMVADRELESGVDGNLRRFQFSAKYGF